MSAVAKLHMLKQREISLFDEITQPELLGLESYLAPVMWKGISREEW
jgi:hypothetical protein